MIKGLKRNSGILAQKKRKNTRRKRTNKTMVVRAAPLSKSVQIKNVGASGSVGRTKLVISNREYLASVTSNTTNWQLTNNISINPGLPTFAWLSGLATRYEFYKFKSFRLTFVSALSASHDGRVMFAMDLDPADAAPTSYVDMNAYDGFIVNRVWEDITVDVRSKAMKHFVVDRLLRYGALAANLDVKTYDLGNLFVAVQGFSGYAGDIYVDYTVEMTVPQRISPVDMTTYRIISSPTVKTDLFPAGHYESHPNIFSALANNVTINTLGRFVLSGIIDTMKLTSHSHVSSILSMTGATLVNSDSYVNDQGRLNIWETLVVNAVPAVISIASAAFDVVYPWADLFLSPMVSSVSLASSRKLDDDYYSAFYQASGVTKTAPMGNNPPAVAEGFLDKEASTRLYFNAHDSNWVDSRGRYLVIIEMTGTGLANPTLTLTDMTAGAWSDIIAADGLTSKHVAIVTITGLYPDMEVDASACTTLTSFLVTAAWMPYR